MMPPVAKTELHLAHAFDGMDVIVRSHSSSQTSRPAPGFGSCCMNIDGVKYTFSGAPAHQLTSWNGRNALEGVIHLLNNNAAKAAALATGTKVKIDHYGQDRDGISEATLAELSFAYMKKYGGTNVQPQPGKPQGFEETGTVSRDMPGIGVSAQSSLSPNHTYEMDADNLKEIG